MAVALVPFAQPIKLSHRSCDQHKILPSISYLSSRDFTLPLKFFLKSANNTSIHRVFRASGYFVDCPSRVTPGAFAQVRAELQEKAVMTSFTGIDGKVYAEVGCCCLPALPRVAM